MQNKNIFSIVEAIKYGFKAFFAHWKVLAQVWAVLIGGMGVILSVLMGLGVASYKMASGIFSSVASGSSNVFVAVQQLGGIERTQAAVALWKHLSATQIFFTFGLMVLFVLLSMSFGIIVQLVNSYIVLKIHDTGSASWRDMFTVRKFFITGIAAALLTMLGTLGGMILFIIPGIYLAIHWMMSPWAVIDEKGSATECLRYSYNIVKGDALRLVGLMVVLGFLSAPFSILTRAYQPGTPMNFVVIVLAIIIFIGRLILSGISAFAFAYVYRKLSDAYEQKQIVRSTAGQMTGVETSE